MGSLNKVMLIGNVGSKEVNYTNDKKPVVRLSIATNENWKDSQGEKQQKTYWHNIVFFGKLAEIAEKYIEKGNPVYIEGKLQTREYEKNGDKKYTTEVVVDITGTLQLLGKKEGGKPPLPTDTPEDVKEGKPLQNDEIPF